MKIHVALFKTVGTYFSTKKNKDVPVTNLFLRVNAGALIPVDVKYFKLPSCDGRDPSYQARFAKLEAFAGLLQKGDELPREIVSVPGQLVVEIYKKEGKYTKKET